jgi:DNA-binding transcriptional ArsR family regulator
LPACDLAQQAGVKAPTISFHLAKLIDGGLVASERSGRHRYYRLADPAVVGLLEALATVAAPGRARTFALGQYAKQLRYARTCYDHLAGGLGVAIAQALVARGDLISFEAAYALSPSGEATFATLGVDVGKARGQRRAFARPCLDWSERRHHLAGALGAALLERLFALGWIERATQGRAVRLLPAGRGGLLVLGVDI